MRAPRGPAVALATGLYISYIPVRFLGQRKWTGAGFLGTIWGVVLLPVVPTGRGASAAFLLGAVLLSVWLCTSAERELGNHDDPRIILDETVGYWAAIAGLPRHGPVLVAAFILFRILDAWKLPPYRWLDRLPGGWGIVLDDVGAAVFANLAVRGLMAWGLF